MKSWLRRAREASGIQAEQCALALCMSLGSYLELEVHPGCISVDELRALRGQLSPEGCSIVREALLDIYPEPGPGAQS